MLSGDQIQNPSLLNQELQQTTDGGLGMGRPDLINQDWKGSN